MPSAEYSHRAIATTDSATAWAELQDPETWGALAGVDEVYDVHHDAEGTLTSYRFRVAAAGQMYDGSARVIEAEALRRMVLDIDTSEVGGRIATQIVEIPDSVQVEVSVLLRSKGFLSTLFFPVVSKALGSGLPRQVDGFAERLSG